VKQLSGASLWILGAIAVITTIIAFKKDPELAVQGARDSFGLFIGILPLMVVGIWTAGMLTSIFPKDTLSRLIGDEAGMKGLFIATIAGAFTPGGPFVQFPLVIAFLKAGAGIASVVTYLTAWSLLGLNRMLVFELPLLGWRLTFARLLASFCLPPLAGLLTKFILTKF